MSSFCDDDHALDGDHGDVDVAFDFDAAVHDDTVSNSNHHALLIGYHSNRDVIDVAADVRLLIHFDDFLPHFYCTLIECNAFDHILLLSPSINEREKYN